MPVYNTPMEYYGSLMGIAPALYDAAKNMGLFQSAANNNYWNQQKDPRTWMSATGWLPNTPQEVKDKNDVILGQVPIRDAKGNPTGQYTFDVRAVAKGTDLTVPGYEGFKLANGKPYEQFPDVQATTQTIQPLQMDAARRYLTKGQYNVMNVSQQNRGQEGQLTPEQQKVFAIATALGATKTPPNSYLYPPAGYGNSNTLVPTAYTMSQGGLIPSDWERILSIMQQDQAARRYSQGGSVDTVPAMLSPDEYVLPKETVMKYGLDKIEKMRQEGLAMRQQMQQQTQQRNFSPGGPVIVNSETEAKRREAAIAKNKQTKDAEAKRKADLLASSKLDNQIGTILEDISGDPTKIPGYVAWIKNYTVPTPGYTQTYDVDRVALVKGAREKSLYYKALAARSNDPKDMAYQRYFENLADNQDSTYSGLNLPDIVQSPTLGGPQPQIGEPFSLTPEAGPPTTKQTTPIQQTPVSYTPPQPQTITTPGQLGYRAWGDPMGLDWQGMAGMNPADVMARLQQEVNRRDTGAAIQGQGSIDQQRQDQRIGMMNELAKQYAGMQGMVGQQYQNQAAKDTAPLAGKKTQAEISNLNAQSEYYIGQAKKAAMEINMFGGIDPKTYAKLQDSFVKAKEAGNNMLNNALQNAEKSMAATKDAIPAIRDRAILKYAFLKNPTLMGKDIEELQKALGKGFGGFPTDIQVAPEDLASVKAEVEALFLMTETPNVNEIMAKFAQANKQSMQGQTDPNKTSGNVH